MPLCRRASEAVNVAPREMLAALFIYVPRGLFGISSDYNGPIRRALFLRDFTFSFVPPRRITNFGAIVHSTLFASFLAL